MHTGGLPCGFYQKEEFDSHSKNYGWGIGAWGTQAWINPKKEVIYVLMVQRANFPNSDASPVREAFQNAAAKALGK